MKILVVDDEPDQRDMLKGFLENQGYHVLAAGSGREALDLFERTPIQLLILDHRMPDLNGDAVLARAKAVNPMVCAIMITAYGSIETAVTVMKLGADDFLEKPVDLGLLLDKIRKIEQRIIVEEEAAGAVDALNRVDLPLEIVGSGRAMKEVLSLVRRLAPTPWTVLIQGETGTGKELVARLVHLLSTVSDGPFVTVNCGAIPENLFESELFGHEKGSFTGAVSSRRGRFEQARNGTLFLDEIGELPLSLQPKLLRAIQEKRFNRVGGEADIAVAVRVVAATNRDMRQQVKEGHFREDLYYRLKVLDMELPPLRSRKEDIPELVDFFMGRYGLQPARFDPDAMALLVRYHFPGNVRELEHVIQRCATMARGSVIHPGDLPPEIRFVEAPGEGDLTGRLAAVERDLLVAALEKAGWVQTQAAAALGISERVLRYKMGKYKIKKDG